MKNKQEMRLSDAEQELLKATFAEADDLLLTVRNVFFGLPLTDEEKKQIRAIFSSAPLMRLMRKQFLPEFQPDIPLGQNIDLWQLADLKGKDEFQITQELRATANKIDFIEKGLARLNDPELENISLSPPVDSDHLWLAGRILYVNHVDRQLQTIKILAGMKTETIEQTRERLLKDSSK